ncbi:metal ABC transporter ATP-binding protein [Candidatus Dependentiae bacterium]|nr:metal ABC transporter ATP-binding protein [Candidatus Dependentiae bacterium]
MSDQLPPCITIKDLTVIYNSKPVIWDLDLIVPQATLLGIIGPNGSGKTTLLKTIMGTIKPIAGTITIHQNNKTQNTQNIAYVPQKNSIDWTFPVNVYDVVMMARTAKLYWYQQAQKKDYEIVDWAIEQVNMSNFKDKHISELSGGQQQRIFLARALAQQADILILDEPFNGIDLATEQLILSVLKGLKELGKTIIVVHHDLNTVQKYFDWTFLMNIKHIALGPTKNILTSENIEKTFQAKFDWNIPL